MRLKPLRFPPRVRALFREAARVSAERSEAVFAVGGYVRDRLLGVPSVDLDLAVEGDGVAFAGDLARRLGGACEGFTRFGTAIVTVPALGRVDIASTRAESYPAPGALPVVKFAGIHDDLVRRDFTLNSIALRLGPRGGWDMVDPTGGREDLRRGVLRAHHARTFEDDPTRVFRAVRFEQRFLFQIEPKTLSWLKAAVKGRFLDRVSGERIRNELKLIFAEEHPERAVRRLARLGVWRALSGGWADTGVPPRVGEALRAFRRSGSVVEEPWIVHLSCIAWGMGERERKALADRLTLSGSERRVFFQCGERARRLLPIVRKKQSLGELHSLLSVLEPATRVVVYLRSAPGVQRRLLAYERREHALRPVLTGKDLIEAGLRPGPAFAGILQAARRLQLEGTLRTRKRALRWLETEAPRG